VSTSDFCQSNTVVVGGAGGALLVDPGVMGAELAVLADDLDRAGLVPVAGFSTHPHWDHLLWAARFGRPPRWATARAAAHARAHHDDATAKADRQTTGNDLDLLGALTPLQEGSTSLPWDGLVVQVVEHDGHAPGHAGLYVVDDDLLVAGDMLSDVEVPLLDLKSGAADPMRDYRRGLSALESVGASCRVLVPGHGSVATGAEVEARFDRDWAYLDALASGSDGLAGSDPRIGPDAGYGSDWLPAEHEAQLDWCRRHRDLHPR
jgi:glyoxylase-like metal-dependent hydrolase (beta-lactamase superfamily II)